MHDIPLLFVDDMGALISCFLHPRADMISCTGVHISTDEFYPGTKAEPQVRSPCMEYTSSYVLTECNELIYLIPSFQAFDSR